jgi:hypothetical protein
MPFALILIGLILIVSGARNTHAAMGAQITKDFTGPNNFITWVVAIGTIGAVGYVEKLRTFSHYFMALIIIGMVLSNKGFFTQFQAALAQGPVSPNVGETPSFSLDINIGSGSGANGSVLPSDGLFGASPSDGAGQSKFNSYMNKLFGRT